MLFLIQWHWKLQSYIDSYTVLIRASQIWLSKFRILLQEKVKTRTTVNLPQVLLGNRSTPEEPLFTRQTRLHGWHYSVRRTQHSWRRCWTNSTICIGDMEEFSRIDSSSTYKNFIIVEKNDTILLWSPTVKGKAEDQAIQRKIKKLNRPIGRLSLLHSHSIAQKQLEHAQVALFAQNNRLQW